MDVSAAISQMVGTQQFGNAIYWLGYGLLGLFLIFLMFVTYYFISFNYKVTVYPLYGSSKDGIFSVQQPKKNKVKWVKHNTAWRKMWPLFNSKDIEPFDAEYIYPGKRIIAFELNNEWVPGRINISKDEQTIRSEVSPVPYFTRNWQCLQYKANAQEYANPGWWDENKHFIMGIITVAICIVGMLVAIYFTYRYLAPGRADIQAFTSALQSVNTLPAIGPS
jgi:hypothetical protein